MHAPHHLRWKSQLMSLPGFLQHRKQEEERKREEERKKKEEEERLAAEKVSFPSY